MTQLASSETPRTDPARATEAFRERLLEERRFRAEQIAALDAERPPTPRHQDVHQALRTAAATALVEIDAALDRMAAGRYGRCVGCGRQIPTDRLDVLPMTALCMSCHFDAQNSSLPVGT